MQFAKEKLKQDATGHSIDHIQRVARNAEQILLTEPEANRRIVLAAAYLHDCIDDKVIPDADAAFREISTFLRSIDFSKREGMAILDIISSISFSGSLGETKPRLSLEGKIVQDADRLDALGVIGILRTAYYGGAKGSKLYDPKEKPRKISSKAEYRRNGTVINHFYEKLLLLAEQMHTDFAREEGARRTRFMKDFLAEFYQECGEKPPAEDDSD